MNSHWCNTHHHTLTICWHTRQEKNWQSVYLSHTCEPLWFKGQLSWWTEELGDGLFMSQLGHVLVIVPSAGPSKMYLLYNMYPSPTGLQWVYSRQTRAETCCHWRSGMCNWTPENRSRWTAKQRCRWRNSFWNHREISDHKYKRLKKHQI